MHNFKKLEIWKKAFVLSKEVYTITLNFPKDEIYGLVSQIRRCSVSIVSNIAEGSGRGSDKEFRRFLDVSIASTFELETQLLLSKELNFIPSDQFVALENNLQELQKMIFGFKKNLSTE